MLVVLKEVSSYNEFITKCELAFRALSTLESNKQKTYDHEGICGTLNRRNRNSFEFNTNDMICDVFKFWEKYSGWSSFPVPHPRKDADNAYWQAKNYWGDDTYGQNRHELNQFCIDYLTEALR